MLLQRHLLLSLLLGLVLSHYVTAQRRPTGKPGTGSKGSGGGGKGTGGEPGGGKGSGGNSGGEKETGSRRYFKCAEFSGATGGKCSLSDNVCVLDYRNKTESICQKYYKKTDVCGSNSIPKQLTCIPNVGCCCKGDPLDVCNGKDDIESFCADFKTTTGAEFPDNNICGEPGSTPKCALQSVSQSTTESVDCGDSSMRCKIDAAGRPAGCVQLTEGTCDQSFTGQGLHCIPGKGCCCVPTKDKSCNSRIQLKTFCTTQANSNFTDLMICPRGFYTRASPKKCENSRYKATSCLPHEPFCKTDINGQPQGCATKCKVVKESNVKCSENECCCEARSHEPCNTWDNFCIEKPFAPVCTSKARKCVDASGKIVNCPFNSPVCAIDKKGNPDGCRMRKGAFNIPYGTPELKCRPGKGCSCNAEFSGPCNSREHLQAHCSAGKVNDPVLCPPQQRQAKDGGKREHKHGSGSGRGTPAVGLVIVALYVPRLAMI